MLPRDHGVLAGAGLSERPAAIVAGALQTRKASARLTRRHDVGAPWESSYAKASRRTTWHALRHTTTPSNRRRGVSLAKGPVAVLGIASLALGVLGFIFAESELHLRRSQRDRSGRDVPRHRGQRLDVGRLRRRRPAPAARLPDPLGREVDGVHGRRRDGRRRADLALRRRRRPRRRGHEQLDDARDGRRRCRGDPDLDDAAHRCASWRRADGHPRRNATEPDASTRRVASTANASARSPPSPWRPARTARTSLRPRTARRPPVGNLPRRAGEEYPAAPLTVSTAPS